MLLQRFLALSFFLYGAQVFCQVPSIGGDDINLPVVTSPAPDAYSFSKFGDVPVSYHTGIPDISIPIYNITTNSGVELPVRLSYHAGGIRVDEAADKTGLGWSLFSGGQISQVINGKKDGGNDYLTESEYSTLNSGTGIIDRSTSSTHDVYDFLHRVYKGEVDSDPDVFSFSFAGHSGKFFVDKTNMVRQIPQSELKITTDQALTHFEITDGKGNVYYFGGGSGSLKNSSGCQYSSPDDPVDSANRSYVLHQITTSNNEIIDFDYRGVTYTYKTSKVESDFEVIKFSNTGCDIPLGTNCENIVDVSEILLTRISFPKGSLLFHYSDETNLGINNSNIRTDLPGAVALRKIILKDTQDNERMNFLLNYDYFQVPSPGPEGYRLKLLEIIKNGQEKHSFSYYQDVMLPPRLSYAQDFWGFYNGQHGNSTTIPELVYGGQTWTGANREIGTLAQVRANTLKRITYPTGGWTDFEFEQNDYYTSGESTNTVYNEQFSLSSDEFSSLIGSKVGYQSQDGEVSEFKLTLYNNCSNNDGPAGLGESYSIVRLRDKNQNLIGTYTASGTYSINSSSGDFSQMTLQMENSGDCSCTAVVSWKRTVSGYTQGNFKAAGLRISKITDNPVDGTPQIKNYTYTVPGTSHSSGATSENPWYYDEITAPGKNNNTTSKCIFLVRQSTPFFGINFMNGRAVAYAHVQESKPGNGYTQYSFTTQGDSPYSSRGWKSGQLLEKVIFEENGDTLQKITNTYAFDNRFVSSSANILSSYPDLDMLAYGVKVSIEESRGSYSYPSLKYEFQYITSSWVKKLSSTTTDFYLNNNVFKSISYEYNNFFNLLPTHTETYDSRGDLVVKDIYYPDDVSSTTPLPGGALSPSASSAVTLMKAGNNHQISEPVQISEVTNGKIFTLRRNYKDYSGLVLPHEIQTAKGTGSLENRLEFLRYDTRGNPIEVGKSAGPSTVYLWGYDDQLPIAKIENATYAEVNSALSSNSLTVTSADETDMNSIDLLRASLSKAMITTYTYMPLVGIAEIKDPQGKITTYQYDTQNRLELISNDEGKVISEYQYNIKTD